MGQDALGEEMSDDAQEISKKQVKYGLETESVGQNVLDLEGIVQKELETNEKPIEKSACSTSFI